MASSGSVESGGYAGRHLFFEWGTQSISSVNNTRTIWYRLTAEGGSASWYYHYNNTLFINGDLMYEGPSQERVYDGDVLDEGTYTINQNNTTHLRIDLDGGIYYMDDNINTGGDWDLDIIPRYTSITAFTVTKRNETSVVYNFSMVDICDYAWYSTNNGSSWTGVDIADGKSGSFTVSGLTPNTTYNFKVRVRRKDSQLTTDSGTVTQTTYKAPTQNITDRTETSFVMVWNLDSTADAIWYSVDGGTNWTSVTTGEGTTGSYVITGLTAGETYDVKTKVRRKSSQTEYATESITTATYSYPHVLVVSKNSLTIGENQTLTLYNPMNRNVTVKMHQNSTSGTELYSGTTAGTSITFTPNANTLYASIPNSATGNCVYSVIYGNSTLTTSGYTYKIIGTEVPIFSNFEYQNSNTTVYNGNKTLDNLTGSNQIIVKGFSNITATVSNANKATAVNSATIKNYSLTVGTKTAENSTISYPVTMSVNAVDNPNIVVAAVDSRGVSTLVTKTATYKEYVDLTINALSLARTNNGAGENVVLTYNGTLWNSSFGAISNTIVSATLKYRKTTESNWSSEYNMTIPTISGNAYSDVYTPNISFDLESSYYIMVTIKDYLETKTITAAVGAGTPAIAIYKDNVAIGQQYNTTTGGKLQVKGNVIATGFVGNLTGAASKSTVATESTPTQNNYYPTFVSSLSGDLEQKVNDGLKSTILEGTSSSADDKLGNFTLMLGNDTPHGQSTSDGNKQGILRLYSSDVGYIQLIPLETSSNLNYYIPANAGGYTLDTKPKNLYNNTTGSNTSVLLSETAANFTYLEIYFRTNDGTNYMSSTKVYSPDSKIVPLNYTLADTGNAIYQKYALATISGTSIALSRGREYYFFNGSTVNVSAANNVYIVRVDGYK